MKKIILLTLWVIWHGSTGSAQSFLDANAQDRAAAKAIERAYAAGNKGQWDIALALAQPAGFVGIDIVEWNRLRAGKGQFSETLSFLRRRPDWPGLPYLRKNSEATITVDAKKSDVISFFAGQEPRTLIGSLRFAQALHSLGRSDEARTEIQRGWQKFSATSKEEKEVIAAFGTWVSAVHIDRLHSRLWVHDIAGSERMLPRVPQGVAKLARARLALQQNHNGVTQLVRAVPSELANDAGLAFDRFAWQLRYGEPERAVSMLLNASDTAAGVGRAEKWAALRLRVARDLMWDGDFKNAYTAAAKNHLSEGDDFAALEWLAGYIALRKLGRADLALFHFQRHGQAVASPISLARSHYWQGRAYAVLGDEGAAKASYSKGAGYQTAFYGILSAEKLGQSYDTRLTGAERFTPSANADFLKSSVYQASRLLYLAGRDRVSVRFLTHLAEELDRNELGQLAAIVEADGLANFELLLAKRGVRYDNMIERHYYPLHPLQALAGDVPPEMALAITRRESEFFIDARSGVGALGLMQVMPRTAREMAGKQGLPWRVSRMTTDAIYNAKIGIAYLDYLEGEFGRSPVQISAAYNAGPSRVHKWTEHLGDPRLGEIDVIDWIEQIPFNETRNYVMRVSESLPNYRARLTGQVGKIEFTKELNGLFVKPADFDDTAHPELTTPRPKARP